MLAGFLALVLLASAGTTATVYGFNKSVKKPKKVEYFWPHPRR